jgi:hypothetical protein
MQQGLADELQDKEQASRTHRTSEPQKKPQRQYSSSEASDDDEEEEEDVRDLEGRIYTKMGREVCTSNPGEVRDLDSLTEQIT